MKWIPVTDKLTEADGHISMQNNMFLLDEVARLETDGIKTKIEDGVLYRGVPDDIGDDLLIAMVCRGKHQIVRVHYSVWEAVQSLREIGNVTQARSLLLQEGTVVKLKDVPWVPGTQMDVYYE